MKEEEKNLLCHEYRVHSHVKIMLKAAVPLLFFFSFVILIVDMQITGKTKNQTQSCCHRVCSDFCLLEELHTTVHYNVTLDFMFLFWLFNYCCKQIRTEHP